MTMAEPRPSPAISRTTSPGLRWTAGVAILVALALAMLLVAGIAVGVIFSGMIARDRQVIVSYDLMSMVRQTVVALQETELGQRNYILTGRAADEALYDQARVRLNGLLRQLDGLAAGNTSWAGPVDALRTLAAREISDLAEPMLLLQNNGRDAALAALRSSGGGSHLANIRQVATAFIEREQLAIATNVTRIRDGQARIAMIAIPAIAGAAALLSWALVLGLSGSRQYRRAQRELRWHSARLQATLETLRDPIAVFDPGGRLTTWNAAFERLTGWNARELHPLTQELLLGEGFARNRALFRTLESGSSDAHVTSRVTSDGRDYEVFLDRMDDGNVVFRCVDITDSLRAELALRQGQKMEAVGQLTGGMAHDFNNILQVVQTNLDLLREDLRGNTRGEGHLQSAVAASQRGARLTQQLLAFARRQPLAPLPIDVVRLVRDMAELLRHSLGERITVEFDLADTISNIKVDPGQLENAILNLALNARDAMPDGGNLRIDVANATLDSNYVLVHPDVVAGDYVLISVTDTGSGMTSEVASRAFDPFFTTKRDGKGTGLGLSMVYGFVQQSGGHVRIDSQPGQGTSVRLYLPRTSEPLVRHFDVEASARSGSERVLVVEDNDEVRSAVAAMLDDLGYSVTAVDGPAAALALLRAGTPFELLFTDVVMPGNMTGVELARTALQEQPQLAVLLTSGYAMDAMTGNRSEAFPIIDKPYRQEDVATKIRAVLAEARARGRTGRPTAESPQKPAPQEKPRATTHVLLVEDETLVRMSTSDMLQRLGCRVEAVASGEQALDVLVRKGPFDMLIADLGLPGMSGEELAAEVQTKYPQLRIVIASGYRATAGGTLTGDIQFIGKPYSYDDLRQVVEGATSDAAA